MNVSGLNRSLDQTKINEKQAKICILTTLKLHIKFEGFAHKLDATKANLESHVKIQWKNEGI